MYQEDYQMRKEYDVPTTIWMLEEILESDKKKRLPTKDELENTGSPLDATAVATGKTTTGPHLQFNKAQRTDATQYLDTYGEDKTNKLVAAYNDALGLTKDKATQDNFLKKVSDSMSKYYKFDETNKIVVGGDGLDAAIKSLDEFVKEDTVKLFKDADIGLTLATQMQELSAVLVGSNDQITDPRTGALMTDVDKTFEAIFAIPNDKPERDMGVTADMLTRLRDFMKFELAGLVHTEMGTVKYANVKVSPATFWEDLRKMQSDVAAYAGSNTALGSGMHELYTYLNSTAGEAIKVFMTEVFKSWKTWFLKTSENSGNGGNIRWVKIQRRFIEEARSATKELTGKVDDIRTSLSHLQATAAFFADLEIVRKLLSSLVDTLNETPTKLNLTPSEVTALKGVLPDDISVILTTNGDIPVDKIYESW
ncbi:MAG TPA: hypothetical protein PLV25_07075, partial [Opitutales bacterium]|nr:hypothetical protein [Opitutales bacterium]